ncbi:coiled-coil domain-containing protein 14 isoform X1 [Salmo trutta]|uniref:coiled-coil domain-containing protein 14 isoform X1 n=1 Tax=Salmo trutta TaxID=8032 RepID=UPI0011312A11|nr:coiled-coil domain-containing protein 14-like isoform X1 [Salmo trutta]
MPKQGLARHKVISSGRLTGGGRGQGSKKRGAGRPLVTSTEPAYSLYSTDSEDQVTTIHKGLDQCAALLDVILQAETAEAKPISVRGAGKTRAAKSRPLCTLGKERVDTERRKQTKRPVTQTAKKTGGTCVSVCVCMRDVQKWITLSAPAPMQKMILSYPGMRNNIQSSAGTSEPASDARFNCRLTTSTPTLSPQRLPPNNTLPPGPSVPLAQPGGSIIGVASVHLGGSTSTAPLASPGAVATSLPTAPLTGPVPSLLAAQPGAFVSGVGGPAAQRSSRSCSLHLGAPSVERLALSAPLSSDSSVSGESGHPISSSCSPSRQGPPVLFSEIHSHPQPLPQPHPLANTQPQSAPDAPSLGRGGQLVSTQDGGALAREACGHMEGNAGEEEEECPVRDTSAQTSFNIQTHTQLAYTHHTHSYTRMALALGCKGCSPEGTARQVMTVQYLLGELKALLAGQDGVAERLVCEVEQTVSLLPVMVGSSNIQAEIAPVLQPLRSENTLLRRRLRIVNQQLQERERAEREARDVHCHTDVSALQSELNDAHKSLQELQRANTELRQALVDTQSQLQLANTELRQALVDTQSQLQQSEVECSRISKDVQSALDEVQGCNSRLEECQKENAALALNTQKRETEIHTLQEHLRALQVPVAESPAVTDIPTSCLPLTKRALDQYQDQQGPSDHPVSQYLWSLEQKGCGSVSLPCKGPECNYTHQQDFSVCTPGGQSVSADQDVSVCVALERKATPPLAFAPLRETVRSALPVEGSPLPVMSQRGGGPQGLQRLTVSLESFPQLKSLFSNLHQSNGLCSNGAGHADLSQSHRCRLDMDMASPGKGRNTSLDSTGLSLCEVRSLASDWSAGSSSTFDTRDEQEFRNGLAALDASIASLQRTIKQDLKR